MTADMIEMPWPVVVRGGEVAGLGDAGDKDRALPTSLSTTSQQA